MRLRLLEFGEKSEAFLIEEQLLLDLFDRFAYRLTGNSELLRDLGKI